MSEVLRQNRVILSHKRLEAHTQAEVSFQQRAHEHSASRVSEAGTEPRARPSLPSSRSLFIYLLDTRWPWGAPGGTLAPPFFTQSSQGSEKVLLKTR